MGRMLVEIINPDVKGKIIGLKNMSSRICCLVCIPVNIS